MRSIGTTQNLALITSLAVSLGAGLGGVGCSPWGTEDVDDGSAEEMPEGAAAAGGGAPTDVTSPHNEADSTPAGTNTKSANN